MNYNKFTYYSFDILYGIIIILFSNPRKQGVCVLVLKTFKKKKSKKLPSNKVSLIKVISLNIRICIRLFLSNLKKYDIFLFKYELIKRKFI